MDEQLIRFVEHARDKGMDHATIRQLLLSAGWKDRDIADVFCTRDLELPIPKPAAVSAVRPRGRQESVWPRRARDAFLHLLAFGALFTCATSLVLLLVTYINLAFPDPAWRTSYAQLQETLSIIRLQLAIVIVSFPIFLILWNFLLREVSGDPEKAKGGIRRWLGYLMVFVGALTLSGDVMSLIYLLLEGQLTTRFLLQAAVLLLIAGGVVLYLVLTLRREAEAEATTSKIHTVFSVASSLVVIVAVVWGVALVGSPGTARLQRFDRQRLVDLQTIFREVQSLCRDPDIKDQLKRPLPKTLDELAALARSERINLTDPETGQRYQYTVKDTTIYELCTTFSMERDSDVDVFWNHSSGSHCFTVDALDPP